MPLPLIRHSSRAESQYYPAIHRLVNIFIYSLLEVYHDDQIVSKFLDKLQRQTNVSHSLHYHELGKETECFATTARIPVVFHGEQNLIHNVCASVVLSNNRKTNCIREIWSCMTKMKDKKETKNECENE